MRTVTLNARLRYNPSYPPPGAKKAYVALITGRASGSMKYAREFLGASFEAVDEDDAGLYEIQHAEKKGGYTRYYYAILPHPDHGLIRSTDCEDLLPKIAKALDDGREIAEIVAPEGDLTVPDDVNADVKFEARILTRAQAKRQKASAVLGDVEHQVRGAVSALEPKAASKLLRKIAKSLTVSTPSEVIR